jgi:hypothetical protein
MVLIGVAHEELEACADAQLRILWIKTGYIGERVSKKKK